jgi:hypothetical protein
MRKLIIPSIIILALVISCNSCVSTRKHDRLLEGLMLQENTRLRINKAYYSRHNVKTRKDAYRKYKKYGRK